MPTQTPITFATDKSRDYATIEALVLNMRGIGKAAPKPVDDITATIYIGGHYVDLPVPDSVYSRAYKAERRWRTPQDVSAREQTWRVRLGDQLVSLAERL